jgi:hypothetical protein
VNRVRRKSSTVRLIAPEDVADDGSLRATLVGERFPRLPTAISDDNAENLTHAHEQVARTTTHTANLISPTSRSTTCRKSSASSSSSQFQWTVTANAVLSPKYAAYATTAAPLPSQLDREADGQAEISRVCNLYTSPRYFYVGTVFAKDGRTFELGDVWDVTYPFRDFEDSSDLVSELSGAVAPTTRRLFLAGIQEQPSEGVATFTFWGL